MQAKSVWSNMKRVLLGVAALLSLPALCQAAQRSDFNGDGFADLAIGVPGQNNGAGGVYVLYGSPSGLLAASTQLWNQASPDVQDVLEAGDNFGAALAWGDVNRDGYTDLAVGVPGEDSRSGAIHILYGSRAGLTAAGNQFWHQNVPGVADTAESGDYFGQALAMGDFNKDGFADLAVGVPGENTAEGMVNVLYGTPSGLIVLGNQGWNQDSDGVPGETEEDDHFGAELAAGDFNGDGFADLAIGTPSEDIENLLFPDWDAGSVYVLYGSASGLRGDGSQGWSQDSDGVPGDTEGSDSFGGALAAGDFNGDGRDDLAVGTAGENSSAGAVYVLYGSSHGLSGTGCQSWSQDKYSVQDVSETNDSFGGALAAGDFNGDGRADLTVGVPGENKGAGAVHILYGSASGLTDAGNQFWSQDSPGIPEVCEPWDWFGQALMAGDFNGDGRADLAIGVPLEDIVRGRSWVDVDAGAVHVLYSAYGGLQATGNQFFYPSFSPAANAHFGISL